MRFIFELEFLNYISSTGLPALIVILSIAVRGSSAYGQSGNCWLSRSNGFMWAVIGPLIVVLLVSSQLYIQTSHKAQKLNRYINLSCIFLPQASFVIYGIMIRGVITSHKVQQQDTLGKVKATARASIIIMPILGFTWIFAILEFIFDELAFKYLFAIFNSLQGLFIFIFHCVMNQQVWN